MMKKATWLRIASPILGLALTAGMLSGFSGVSTVNSSSPAGTFRVLADWAYLEGTNPINYLDNGTIGWQLKGTIDLPLAFTSMINSKDNYPAIASHWSRKGKTIDLWIHSGAKWSNGAPVTTQDVITSIDIAAYLLSTGIGPNLGSVKAVGPNEVQVTEVGHNALFMDQLLNKTFIFSAAEYGKYVPSNLATLSKESLSSNAKVAGLAATKLANDYKKASTAKFPFLSNGPYVVTGWSSSEAVLGVNKYFWAASTVKKNFPVEKIYNTTGNPEAWPYYETNRVSYSYYVGPMTIIRQWLKTNGHLIIRKPGFGDLGIALNPHIYPFNLQPVRQAIAYLIHRAAVTNIGDPIVGNASKHEQFAFAPSIEHEYMSASQIASLNPYNYNRTKAADLLRSVGFKYHNNQWYMPDGKPFKVTIWLQSATDWEADGEVIAGELSKAGIDAVATIAPGTTFGVNQPAGKYAVYEEWGANGGPDPYEDVASTLGYYGYSLDTTTGTIVHAKGVKVNLGPLDRNYKLSDGQTVNIFKDTIALNTAVGSKRSQLMTDIAQAFNQSMIDIPIFGYASENFVDSQNIVGWPQAMAPWDDYDSRGVYSAWIWMGWLHPRTAISGICSMANASLKVLDSTSIDGCPLGGVSLSHLTGGGVS